MYCKKCGKELDDSFNVCPYCGAKVDNVVEDDPSTQIYEQSSQYESPYVHTQTYVGQSNVNNNDSGSFWYGLLSLFVPIVGFVLWIVWRKTKPKTAKVCLIGFILGFVLSFLSDFLFGNLIDIYFPTEPVEPSNPGVIL